MQGFSLDLYATHTNKQQKLSSKINHLKIAVPEGKLPVQIYCLLCYIGFSAHGCPDLFSVDLSPYSEQSISRPHLMRSYAKLFYLSYSKCVWQQHKLIFIARSLCFHGHV